MEDQIKSVVNNFITQLQKSKPPLFFYGLAILYLHRIYRKLSRKFHKSIMKLYAPFQNFSSDIREEKKSSQINIVVKSITFSINIDFTSMKKKESSKNNRS